MVCRRFVIHTFYIFIKMSAVFYFIPLLLQLCSGALLPLTKCKLSDTECLKSSAQMAIPLLAPGIPELKADPIDEMHLDLVKVNLAGLNLVVTDAHVKGLKNSKIQKISVDLDKKQIKYAFVVDAAMKGKYVASGQLLVLPISGDGDIVMNIKNAHLDVTHNFELVKNSDGKDIIKMKSFSFTYDVKDGAFFDLTGLFNGNKELSEAMLKFMNENWKVLTEEFGEPILRACLKVIHSTVKKYLQAHPLEELADL